MSLQNTTTVTNDEGIEEDNLEVNRPGLSEQPPQRARPLEWDVPRAKGLRERVPVAWRLSSRWWSVSAVVALGLTLIFASLSVWGNIELRSGVAEPYLVHNLLKDGADIALKLGAVVGGMLAVYRYWYHRYEPLVYFVSCGLIPRTLLEDLYRNNPQFQRFASR
jgi:hypothetical protein